MATGSITWAGAQQASTAHWLPVKVSKDCTLSTEEMASLIQEQDAGGEAPGMHGTLDPIPVLYSMLTAQTVKSSTGALGLVI